MLLHPWRFMKSEWDKGAPIENFALSGIISSIDEGRGLKIRVSNLDTLLRINGLQAVNNNAKNEKNSFFEFGDSLIKLPDNDTFKIIRHDTTYIWKIAESSLNRH